MKTFEFVIEPHSGFGTPLKGDTLFGQFCWQLIYGTGGPSTLESFLVDYEERPFIVFSDAVPRFGEDPEVCYAFNRPALPLRKLFLSEVKISNAEMVHRRKELKARRWMLLDGRFLSKGLHESMFLKDSDLVKHIKGRSERRGTDWEKLLVVFEQHRNSINRLTGTTGEDGFAPYVVSQGVFAPGLHLSVFVGIDTDRISPETVADGLRQIGLSGFGRDASVGLGRFEVLRHSQVDFGERSKSNACFTLSPCVPGAAWQDVFFTPFVRFGRHGGAIASSGTNPFKSPVIMASAGAVLVSASDIPDTAYVGRAVTNISKAEPKSVCQGYSLYIPFRMEVV